MDHLGCLWTLVLFGVGDGIVIYEGFICNLVVICLIFAQGLVCLLWCFCNVCIIYVLLVFQCVVPCLVWGIWLVLCILWVRVGSII